MHMTISWSDFIIFVGIIQFLNDKLSWGLSHEKSDFEKWIPI